MRYRALAITLAAAATLVADRANACASCNCGDPTLTGFGIEKPSAGRLRAGLDTRFRTDAVGVPGQDRLRLEELRFDAQGAFAPLTWLFVSLSVPILHRTVRYESDAVRTSGGLGDVELRAKLFVYHDRATDPRHLVAVTGGVKTPTAPRAFGPGGAPLPIELQPGTGTWDPNIGLSYAAFARPFSGYASVMISHPLAGTKGSRASPSMRTTTAAQYALSSVIAGRIGLDTRLDAKAYEGGMRERDSGGFIAFGSLEALLSPLTDVLFVASLRVPVLSNLAGYHREGPIYGLAVAFDF